MRARRDVPAARGGIAAPATSAWAAGPIRSVYASGVGDLDQSAIQIGTNTVIFYFSCRAHKIKDDGIKSTPQTGGLSYFKISEHSS